MLLQGQVKILKFGYHFIQIVNGNGADQTALIHTTKNRFSHDVVPVMFNPFLTEMDSSN